MAIPHDPVSAPRSSDSPAPGGPTRRQLLRAAAGAGLLVGPMSVAWAENADAPTSAPSSSKPPLRDPATGQVDWPAVRGAFALAEGLVYLNNGSLGPMPQPVREVVRQAFDRIERDPATEAYGPMLEAAEAVRARVAAFFHCATEEMVLTSSTTDGMNLVATGLDLAAGDRVLTTDQEHPGGLAGWEFVAKHRQIVIDRVNLPVPADDEDQIVERFRESITPQTKVISVSHVTYLTGLRLPIARLAELARERGIYLVVDGAQSAGMLTVDVKSLGCHAYATSGHKWLLGPIGTGLLYLNRDAPRRVETASLSRGPRTYTGSTGTRNLPGILGLGAAIDFLTTLNPKTIEPHVLSLRQRFATQLSEHLPALRPISSTTMPSAIVSFALPDGTDASALVTRLRDRHRIAARAISAGPLPGLRFSLHVYNHEREIAVALAAIRAELS